MKQELKDFKFKGKVNNQEIRGNTYKEFVINYLTELSNQYINLDISDRLNAYINYFVNNFHYDSSLRDQILSHSFNETRENREQSLFELFYNGKGVCDQLAQAFSLLGTIDPIWKKNIIVEYATCNLMINGKKISHAVNHIVVGKQRFILDLSTMIHCKQKDKGYKANSNDFKLISMEQYVNSLSSIGIDLIPFESDIYFANLYLHIEPDEYFKRLTTPTDEINSQHTDWIQPGITIVNHTLN